MTVPADQVPLREVVILGSTGSIGTQALEVVRAKPGRFRVVGLTAGGSNRPLFEAQVEEFRPRFSGLGEQASIEAAQQTCDIVINGITGAVGLRPTVAALEAGNVLGLANKESLIIGGSVVTDIAAPGQIIPVDSEHSAIAQCLRSGAATEVHKLVLTASGGPFRGRSRDQLQDVTVAEALAHPTWDMGPVVTINSATLMNKGLEVIEAHLLFGIPMDRIEVVVHPTSVVHSMVEFVDGSTIAQASPPTMLIPIALALSWPERLVEVAPAVDWTRANTWEFLPLDNAAFPAVSLARDVGARGGTAPAIFNAANEVCVQAFRDERLPFPAMVETVAEVLQMQADLCTGVVTSQKLAEADSRLTIDDVLQADAWARETARTLVDQRSGKVQ